MSHWFKRRRSLAFGIVACGSSMGGTVIPILVRKLIPRIGCVCLPAVRRSMSFA